MVCSLRDTYHSESLVEYFFKAFVSIEARSALKESACWKGSIKFEEALLTLLLLGHICPTSVMSRHDLKMHMMYSNLPWWTIRARFLFVFVFG